MEFLLEILEELKKAAAMIEDRKKKENHMKKLLIVLMILFASSAFAADISWQAAPEAVDGYALYYNTSPNQLEAGGIKTFLPDVTELQDFDTVLSLQPGVTYYFSITAWNIIGRSGLSEAVSYKVPGGFVPAVDTLLVGLDIEPPAIPTGLIAEIVPSL